MAFTIYRSTEVGAPSLQGVTGRLISVLDACLTTGFGSRSGLGWTKSYASGTTIAAYQMPSGVGFYIRVNDAAPGNAANARLTGYETMTDINTGTGLFPATYVSVRKSTSADATNRAWTLVGDSKTIYFFCQPGDNWASVTNGWVGFAFGAFSSLSNPDSYNCMIQGDIVEAGEPYNKGLVLLRRGTMGDTPGCYFARGYTGLGGPVAFMKTGDVQKWAGANTNVTLAPMAGLVPFPALNGGFMLSRVWLIDRATSPTSNLRGWMRGFWHWLHPNTAVVDGDILTGTGDLAGRTFLVIKPVPAYDDQSGSQTQAGCFIIETSDTVDT